MGVLVRKRTIKELRKFGQCEVPTNWCEKTLVTSNFPQLFNSGSCSCSNSEINKIWGKRTHFDQKTWFKNYFWMVLGHVWTGIFTLVNLPPTLSMNCIFLRQKSLIDFLPIFCPFSLLGRLPQAIPTPWKCFLGVPWWKTFHLGPRKPPKPLLAKKDSSLPNPKLHSQPSVRCLIDQTCW